MGPRSKPYSFSVEAKPGYLHVRVSGENTPETVTRYVGETLEACRAHDLRRVLIEEDLEGPSLSQMQMFDLIADRGDARPPAVTIAYVDVNPRHDAGLLRFAETAARNRGFLLHLFATVRDAEEWLAAP
jgi:hypothetical protein